MDTFSPRVSNYEGMVINYDLPPLFREMRDGRGADALASPLACYSCNYSKFEEKYIGDYSQSSLPKL